METLSGRFSSIQDHAQVDQRTLAGFEEEKLLQGTGTPGNEAAILAEHLGARARPHSRYSDKDFGLPATSQRKKQVAQLN